MGRPKFPRKQYDTPLHPWKEERIKSERALIRKYGLKNHREVWKAKTRLRKYRGQARELLAKFGGNDPQVEKESNQLLLHLTRIGILPQGGTLDDVLALETEHMLSRRLQTLVYQRGLANTSKHARQLVSHGHINIADRCITIPGYIVPKDEENDIGYSEDSPLISMSHPARPKTDVYKPGGAPGPAPAPGTKEPGKQPVSPSKGPQPTQKTPEKESDTKPVEKEPEQKQQPTQHAEAKPKEETPAAPKEPVPAPEQKPQEKSEPKPEKEPAKQVPAESKEKPKVDTKEEESGKQQKETSDAKQEKAEPASEMSEKESAGSAKDSDAKESTEKKEEA